MKEEHERFSTADPVWKMDGVKEISSGSDFPANDEAEADLGRIIIMIARSCLTKFAFTPSLVSGEMGGKCLEWDAKVLAEIGRILTCITRISVSMGYV